MLYSGRRHLVESAGDLQDFLGLVGVSLGPYVVREIASLGGVALVYRGEHETLHHAVAIKVLTPEVASGEVRETLKQLFLREAQILSQLRSEHILRAHHHGSVVCPKDGKERPYLIVDWLEGHTLSDELDERRKQQRPYALQEAVDLLEPVAQALDTAHAAGIVHRDVNPRNVFLERAGEGQPPRAKLIDFGFAKDVAQTRALQLQRVHGTLLARSPDYAAPEHYDREKYGELSENTDIYTFALMFVEMLTLESPLRGATTEALAHSTADRDNRPTPNSRGARVPDNVEDLFAEALAVDQFERPGSILAWYRSLQQAVRRPTTRPPPRPSVATPRRPNRTWLWATGGLLVAGAVAAGAFVALRPPDCAPGFADCNGERSDGCEVELARSPLHCGGCGNACPTADGVAACVNGACRIERCADETRRDCNGSPGDGCEVDVSGDPQNCGGCGKRCGADGTTKVACQAGKCVLDCSKDRGDCDGTPENGCEIALSTDVQNCGRCGFSCPGTTCERGFCVPRRLARLGGPVALVASGGALLVWDQKTKEIQKVTSGGELATLADSVAGVSGLALGGGAAYWVGGDPPKLQSLALGADAGAVVTTLAGPLAGPTPLVLDVSGTYLSFADRSARVRPGPGKPKKHSVSTLELGGGEDELRTAKCPDWPAQFAGDERQQFCCDVDKPLYSITCPGGKCASRRHGVPCPSLMVLDDERLYFARGTRLWAMERWSGQARQLAKRVRAPRALAQDATHLYWIEGEDDAAIFRMDKPSGGGKKTSSPDAPIPIAAHLTKPSALAVDDSGIYWSSRDGEAGGGEALVVLQKNR